MHLSWQLELWSSAAVRRLWQQRCLHRTAARPLALASRSRSRSMHLHGYSSAFPRIRTNHHYVAQPGDFGPRRAHGAFGLFRLTRIYLSTYLPAYPLHYPLYCVSVLLPSVVVSHIVRPVRGIAPQNCPASSARFGALCPALLCLRIRGSGLAAGRWRTQPVPWPRPRRRAPRIQLSEAGLLGPTRGRASNESTRACFPVPVAFVRGPPATAILPAGRIPMRTWRITCHFRPSGTC